MEVLHPRLLLPYYAHYSRTDGHVHRNSRRTCPDLEQHLLYDQKVTSVPEDRILERLDMMRRETKRQKFVEMSLSPLPTCTPHAVSANAFVIRIAF